MKIILPVFILTLIFAACSRSPDKEISSQDLYSRETPPSPKQAQGTGQNKPKQLPTDISSTADTSSAEKSSQVNTSNPDWSKKIIKTAYLKFEVKNFKTYADIVHKAARQYNGYVANEEQNQAEDKIETTILIKIPVDQFESIMNDLPLGVSKIIEKKITTEDVTGEIVDTKSRLEAKKQVRLKYLEFLKQSKNMTEVLQVQDEINNIQEEIEAASGRINYLSHQSVYSSINITFYQPFIGYEPTNDNPGFFTKAINAFKSGFSFIAELLIEIISIWPVFLLVILGWLFWKRRISIVNSAKQKA